MLQLSGLRKTFGSIVAVDDLSLDIRRGEVFGLLGPNGAGKTTAIGMAVGLLRPDAGQVNVGGAGSPTNGEVRRRIGVAPQALALYEEMTADENLLFFGRLYGMSGTILRRRADELLEFVGLSERRRHLVRTYSGGMKRRLNLAVALVHSPRLIVLDEPTVGVDPQSRNAIFELVENLKSDGHTVIYTTHYMEEAQRLCGRVGILDHGRLLALDSVDGLISAHGHQSVVVIERAGGDERISADNPREILARTLEETDVLSVRVERPDLESVFLTLTGRSLRD